ncbi:MAG: AMP-binding protein [Burkholderiaceae bacterium]
MAEAARSPLQVLRLYPSHDGSLADLLRSRVSVAPDRECLIYQGHSLSYAKVQAALGRTAAVLAARGVRAGDRIAIMSRNHPSAVLTLLALASLGATTVPLNPDYGAAETAYVLGHAEVAGVICAPELLERVQAACAALGIAPWLLLNEAGTSADAASPLPVLSVEADNWNGALPGTAGTADATCVFIYTSGTTGFPKGVMHSQRSLVTAGEGFVERMHLQPEDRLLCILPMFHINAIFYSLGGALAAGATLILEPRFSVSKFWQVVKDTGATEVNTIAAASSMLMLRPRSEFIADHSLQKIYGAPFSAETYRVFHEEFQVPTLIEGYGMSEIPGALNNPFEGPHKAGSMGQPSRHPDPSVQLAELRICDEAGNFRGTGEVGELVVRTPIVMQGYFKDEAQTCAAFRDGWFLTGDLASVDADNFFWFVARKKDIIRKRGENISGAELDRIIGDHPAVLEAAAIPVPDELGEDEILVAVVARPGMAITPDEVAQWCRERLAAIKVPRYVALVDTLPHTPTHRVEKFKLRQDKAMHACAVDLRSSKT